MANSNTTLKLVFLRIGFTDFQAYFKIVGLYLFLYFLVLSKLLIHIFCVTFIVIFNFSVAVNWIKLSKMEYKNNFSSTSEELPSNGTYLLDSAPISLTF